MKYQEGSDPTRSDFLPWQPSTWPPVPTRVDGRFVSVLERIIDESMLGEIGNTVEDVQRSNGDLQHRGHVVAIAMMCALDALASYGYREKHVEKFVRRHFPPEYRPFSDRIYHAYRVDLVHSWNLFGATILPGNERIQMTGQTLSFGLLNFLDALRVGAANFLDELQSDPHLQRNTLNRYAELRATAKP